MTLGLSAWLGFEAVAAAQSHRRAAEDALQDYAEISADELERAIENRLDHALDEHLFDRVQRRTNRRTLAPVEDLYVGVEDLVDDHVCDCPTLAEPLVIFRYEASTGNVQVLPDTIAPERVQALANQIFADWYRPDRSGQGFLTTDTGELLARPTAVAYAVMLDSVRDPRAVYGIVFEPADVGAFLLETYEEERLLPPQIAEDQPNDSLISATVSGPDGVVVFRSPVTYPPDLSAQETMAPWLDNFVVEVTVRPDEASQLITGGLPESRLGFIIPLLLLTLGVGLATLFQLKKEFAFQRLREDFVSGVSHELRTPLAQIRMFAELQEAGRLTSGEDRKRAVSVIHRESRRLSHLVENLLQFSQLQRSDKRNFPVERMDLAGAIAEGVDAVTPLIEGKGMTVRVEAEAGVPVLANRGGLTRIVVNLLDNAVKYGPEGQTVSVGVDRAGDEARISVADQGPGVPAPDRERIWEAYRRLDRDIEGPQPGTGIGLAVVAELAAQHGGRAWVEKADGGGARFVVALPIAESVTERDSGTPTGRPRGVLIAGPAGRA